MILLLLWACAGVALGYEAARHGIVQIIVPTLYLLAMFAWLIAGMVIFHFVTSRKARPVPTLQQIRDAYGRMSCEQRAQAPQKEQAP